MFVLRNHQPEAELHSGAAKSSLGHPGNNRAGRTQSTLFPRSFPSPKLVVSNVSLAGLNRLKQAINLPSCVAEL